MISVIKATEKDYKSIVTIGKVSVAEAHRGSSSVEDMNEFLESHYNDNAINKAILDICFLHINDWNFGVT